MLFKLIMALIAWIVFITTFKFNSNNIFFGKIMATACFSID
ncbi:putative membrane protein [Staphylococcus aureus Lyso 1 2010]|nr:hypothetical protein SA21262_1983 [Staphylococcus aureus subsp. aureus 21262]EHQ64687.1 hypothetical protein SA21343_0831 [Staphylococcus aureus subsp. aureus 21343]EHS32689.1 hypothetical protein IS122_0769 [Staphylococcus aureus subsp. aureus IS-122]EHT51434.1 putative membrane protein [Staphylococcus aureus subsp. aureus CIG1150]ERE93624.1 hypothetical protein CO08_2096 [Staphylococcus aureus subsp. aureus CO-08]KDP55783.1 hypothetical protein CO86_0582 [Staphylococcus aureus subsp. aure